MSALNRFWQNKRRYVLPQITVRQIMISVVVFGVMTWLFLNFHYILDNLFVEYFYVYNAPIRKAWEVGQSTSVMVDLFEGSITAVQGVDGEVAVDIDASVGTKRSRAAAEQALKTLDLGFH